MPNIQLAHNLRYLRNAYNLTQNDLSAILNISRQAYSNYENCKRMPDLDTLIRISNFYHITLDDLVNANLSASSGRIAEERAPYHMALDMETGNTIYLTASEVEFITKIRLLSDNDKHILTGFLNSHISAF